MFFKWSLAVSVPHQFPLCAYPLLPTGTFYIHHSYILKNPALYHTKGVPPHSKHQNFKISVAHSLSHEKNLTKTVFCSRSRWKHV